MAIFHVYNSPNILKTVNGLTAKHVQQFIQIC